MLEGPSIGHFRKTIKHALVRNTVDATHPELVQPAGRSRYSRSVVCLIAIRMPDRSQIKNPILVTQTKLSDLSEHPQGRTEAHQKRALTMFRSAIQAITFRA